MVAYGPGCSVCKHGTCICHRRRTAEERMKTIQRINTRLAEIGIRVDREGEMMGMTDDNSWCRDCAQNTSGSCGQHRSRTLPMRNAHIASTAGGQTTSFTVNADYTSALERIAEALERIAAALEWAPSDAPVLTDTTTGFHVPTIGYSDDPEPSPEPKAEVESFVTEERYQMAIAKRLQALADHAEAEAAGKCAPYDDYDPYDFGTW